jgi:hypothetical protein
MRAHIYLCMRTNRKDPLPEPQIEGAPLGPGEPVRFVWGRTCKQSPHNAAMKHRIITDLKERREVLYGNLSAEEFVDKKLEPLFDQAFKTLKDKYKAQTNSAVALYQKARDGEKAKRSRRRERKKLVSISRRSHSESEVDLEQRN